MFSELIKTHKIEQRKQRQQKEVLRRQATQAVGKVTGSFLDSVNHGVSQVYENQQRLENQTKALQAQTAIFSKQTQSWLTMYKDLNQSLMELGDVTNWANAMERDLNEIADTLEGVASRQTALTKAEEEEAAEEYSHLNTAEV